MKGIYTFTAGFRREEEPEKQITNACTHEEYLCRLHGKRLLPMWDSKALEKAGISRQEVEQYKDIFQALKAGKGKFLVKFGKQDGYWVWNIEAAERKKLEEAKTVYIYERKSDEFDDEGTLCLNMKNYPAQIKAIIIMKTQAHSAGFGRTYYEITNYNALAAALKAEGWKLNK